MARTSKRKSKGAKEYKSPFEPIEDIERAAEECRDLLQKGIVTLELRYPNEVHFRIDEGKYKELGKTQQADGKFRRLLRDEVTKGLISVLTGKISDSFPPPQFLDLPEDKYTEEAERIRDKVGEVLCTEDLRAWHEIKNTAKTEVLQSVDWEINLKKAERGRDVVRDIPHAIVRFWVQKTVERGGLAGAIRLILPPIMAVPEQREYHVLDMHERDVKNLIADLTKVLNALAAVVTEK